MHVSEEMFLATVDKWTFDVRTEALQLFRDGVAHDRCVNIAIAIVEGKDLERSRQRSKFVGMPHQ